MAVPMYLLYEGGIVMSRILLKKRDEKEDSATAR
jgi:Sec-independent protein secretion pathway component TatC